MFNLQGDAYCRALKRRGFERIGSGHYSRIFAKPGSTKVLKVCVNVDGDEWPRFAMWAVQNPGPMVPRIYSLKWHGHFYVAVLDRMADTVDDSSSERSQKLRRVLCGAGHQRSRIVDALRSVEEVDAADLIDRLMEQFPNCRLDAHANNWMFDVDGNLFLTDPFSDGERAIEKVRLKLAA